MTKAEPSHRFLRACLRLPVDRTPAWMMRQAGRYLPQYRAVRSKTTFQGLLRSPDLACEVTLQPIDEYGMDAAILFSDILVPLEAMGISVDFPEGGPVLSPTVKDRADVERLGVPDPEQTMGYVLEAVGRIRKGLAGRVPLIGFAGAPFTLGAYAVEGGGSKSWTKWKRMLFGAPEVAHLLLGKLADTVALSLEAQVAAGAEAVQIFDSWAGVLSPEDFSAYALPYVERIVTKLRASRTFQQAPSQVPIIYFVNGVAPYLDLVGRSGADVIGIDWRMDLGEARRRLGPAFAVQGNLDPTVLFAPPAEIEARVRRIVTAGKSAPGYVFNLGHGVLPETDPEHVRAMFAAVARHG